MSDKPPSPVVGSFPRDSFDDFDRRLAEIHGLDNRSQRDITMAGPMNVGRSELQAMVDSFLGENYDAVKVAELERVQLETNAAHGRLADAYQRDELGPLEYIDQFNAVAFDSFAKIERILGQADSARLFGPPPDRSAGFIDRQAFMRAHQERLACKN